MPSLTSARILAAATVKPDLDALTSELQTVLAQAGAIQSRQTTAHDLRHNIWDGQSDDFRRHAEDIGDKAQPFEGAPDERVPVVDTLIRLRTALYLSALLDADIQAVPLAGLERAEDATKTSRTLRWLRQNILDEELTDEAELLASYVEGDDPGLGIMKVWWKRELARELRTLTYEDIAVMILSAMGVELDANGAAGPEFEGHLMEVADILTNREREDHALQWLSSPGLFPLVETQLLRRSLARLRREGETELPVPYVKENRPCLSACRYMGDVFFRSEYDDIQKARVVFEHLWLTEPELQNRVLTEDWDANFVDALLEAGPGPAQYDRLANSLTRQPVARSASSGADDEAQNTYEVWVAYTRATDSFGIEGVYQTVFSLKLDDAVGYHGLLGYPHGEYPFVQFRAEHIARGAENIRGTPARAGSRQAAIKLQRDSRGAHTMLATVPPYTYHERLAGLEIAFGPLVGIPRRDKEDIAMLPMPQFPASSKEMEDAAWRDLALYFGLRSEGVPEDLVDALLKHDVIRWLKSCRKMWSHILQLQQAYGDPAILALVSGGPMQPITREEIRGRFAIQLTFSVRDLNLEFVKNRNAAISEVLAQDLGGQVDRTPIVRAGLRAIDPALADRAFPEPEAVTRAQIDDQQSRVGKMAAGIAVPPLQGPSNAKLRFQTLMETVNGSPTLARRYHQPATPDDQTFRDLVGQEAKNLGFLVEQYTVNPTVGLTGVKPNAAAV
jgi:hypothetical protein